MSDNSRTCACTTQQFSPIIFNNVGYQNSANTVYENKVKDVADALMGTRVAPNGNPIFKSDYERMQYLLGKQNRGNGGAGCGAPAKAFVLGAN
jgi:hypothetical protein